VRDDVAWLDQAEVLPPHLRGRYAAAALAIADEVDRRLLGVPVHRIHGDLHLGNLLVRDGLLRILDFDDMATGPPVQDLWLALPGRGPEAIALRERFLEGYEQLRAFDRSTLALVEPLRGLRIVHYAAWLARRWHDPAFPRTWPQFAEPDYWDRETADLEEQLAVIRGEARAEELARSGGPPEPEAPVALTNKDYFWDWEG
jgi:Ser/Thr protein kinase RdoA (MazF antagonist)